ncbi:MAG: peptidylprolyl isomerase [Anaerolineae bacterium]|nr:peptidylprolyl isomerase [Anaerolineae bacterium]
MKPLPDLIRAPFVYLIVLLAALSASCSTAQPGAPSEGAGPGAPSVDPTPDVVAMVNGEPISMAVFERELARFNAGRAALGLEASNDPAYQQQVLNTLIDNALVRQEAARRGITASEDQISAEIDGMILQTGEEYFNGWLAGNFYTIEEFREAIRDEITSRQLLEPVIASVPTVAEYVHARHILVNSELEAQEVLQRLAAGEDFAALALEYSVDVTTREIGGDLGWFTRGNLLVPEVETVAFSQQPGQTSGVVSSSLGYHIVQTLEFDPARAVDEETRQRLIQTVIENWQQDLREAATIEQKVTF